MMASETFTPVVRNDGTFRVFAPATLFEKAGAPDGQQRRIGGIISTDTKDQEGETILQHGLDLGPFVRKGHFNDNHSKLTADIVGEPDPAALKFFRKGDRLPDGSIASANGHWAEGWIYDDPRSDLIWQKAKAMMKSPGRRRLGFSIEGAILHRTGPDRKTIAKAVVHHVAVTAVPVNTDTRLDVLAKGLTMAKACVGCAEHLDSHTSGQRHVHAVDHEESEAQARAAMGAAAPYADLVPMDGVIDMDLRDRPLEGFYGHVISTDSSGTNKALTAGTGTGRPVGPQVGAGAGRVIMPQSLEHDAHPHGVPRMSKSIAPLSGVEALAVIRSRFPNISFATAGRIVDLTLSLQRRGRGGQHG